MRRTAVLILAATGLAASLLAGCTAYSLRRVTIGDARKVEYSQYGSGLPVIVFMSGLGNTMDTWKGVYFKASKASTAVMYNRMGYGRSSKTDTPRTADQIVSELREFLTAAGYRPPYLLVAHSAAGLYAVYYARASPDEVGGMVLVDASHWEQIEYARKNQKDSFVTSVMKVIGTIASSLQDTGMAKEEFAGLDESSRQVIQGGQFPDIPLIVLSGTKHGSAGPISEEKWQEWQQDLARLSPRGRLLLAHKSGHFIQKTEPDLINDAIREVLAEMHTADSHSCVMKQRGRIPIDLAPRTAGEIHAPADIHVPRESQ